MNIILAFIKKLDFKTLLILCLVGLILIMRMCQTSSTTVKPGKIVKVNGKKYEELKHTIDTQYITVTKIVYKPGKDIYHETIKYVNVPLHVDTSAILYDYYLTYVYKDTLQLKDSLGWVSVQDTISQNKIVGRVWKPNVNKIYVRESIIVKELPKNKVYFGGVMGFDKNNVVNFAGPSVIIKNKKDKIYTFGVGYSNSKAIALQGGIYWLIKLKK